MPEDLPRPIGPDVNFVLSRVALLKEHADAVIASRVLHRQCWLEMLGREVEVLVLDGFSPRLAEAAATNNLALRRQELDEELAMNLERLQDELRRKVLRLQEDKEDAEE